MFTGIIEDIGIVEELNKSNEFLKLKISSIKINKDVYIGDSISVNGVCLTVDDIVSEEDKKVFGFSVVHETLLKTNLDNLEIGSIVNLERAVKFSDRLNGHLVQGHIEDVGTIIQKKHLNSQVDFLIKLDSQLMKYCIVKGSIAIDGISLTIADQIDNSIKVAIIPHTLENTNLKSKTVDDTVNIETDIIAKYIENLIERK